MRGRPQGAGSSQSRTDDDIFIPPNEINGAMQGDQVLVEVEPPKADGRRQGRIVRVLERRNPTVVGIFHYARSTGRMGHSVVPFDERMTQHILIPAGQEAAGRGEAATPHRVLGAKPLLPQMHDNLEGLVVDVEITSWPTPTRPPIGRVIEVLGDPDDFGVDVEMMIRKHQLPRVFPEKVLAEARGVAHLDLEEIANRAGFSRAADCDHRRRDGARFRRCGAGDRARRAAATSCRCTLPTWRSMCAQARISISKRGCAAPASTFPIAPFPCCRRSFRPTSAACGPVKTGWC